MRYHQFRKRQRFLFCLSPYLFSEWHIVPQLYIYIKLSRVHSRKALSECKASRRLGKQIRGLSRFLSKSTLQQFFVNQQSLSLKGQSPSRHPIIRTTLHSLNLFPRLMQISIHILWQFPFLRQ